MTKYNNKRKAKASDRSTHGVVLGLPPSETGHLDTLVNGNGSLIGNESVLLAGTDDTNNAGIEGEGEQSVDPCVLTVPFTGGTCGLCVDGGVYRALNLKGMLEHCREKHKESTLSIACSKCGKRFASDKSHAAACHVPKCKGSSEARAAEVGFKCEACPRSFPTKSGLSQHENTCAPEIRNRKRIEGVKKVRAPSQRASKFTEEIKNLIAQMVVAWDGEGSLNDDIAKRTGLTAKQVSDKRREKAFRRDYLDPLVQVLPSVSESELVDEVGSAVEAGDTEVEESPAEQLQADPKESVGQPNKDREAEEDKAWRTALLESIRKLDANNFGKDASEIVRLLRHAADLDPAQERIDTVLAQLEQYCRGQKETDASAGPAQRRQGAGKKTYKKGKRKRTRFALTQNLFKKDKRALAKLVLAGTDVEEQEKVAAPREQVDELYHRLWGVKSTCRIEPAGDAAKRIPVGRFAPITADAVTARLKRMSADTAPGRDGLKKSALLGPAKAEILAQFFNLILAWGVWPTEWKTNRTTLLPKEGKDPTLAANYRPLTISSTVNRVFMGILDGHIRSLITIHPRQKGFVAEPGCYQNIQILDQALRKMRRQGGGVAVQLDISKAFDTVPHEAIVPTLRRKGLPEQIVQLILESYKDTKTSIRHNEGDIIVNIVRGVKQGDPMSPLLFILIIEPLLEKLEEMEGLDLGGERISSLAFADDLYLLAGDVRAAQALMDETARILGNLGMSISASKSFAFQYKTRGKSWALVDPCINLQGERIPRVGADERLTYLGVQVSPWRDGVTLKGFEDGVAATMERLRALALKPHQRLALLKENLLPHWQYILTAVGPPCSVLKRVDATIRKALKLILHLPKCTTDGLFYSRCADGGLGVQKFEHAIPRYILSQGLKLGASQDALCRVVYGTTDYAKRLQNAAKQIGLSWPVTEQEIVKAKRVRQKQYLKEWSQLRAQGQAVHAFKGDGIGNCWLRDPELLKPNRFLTALQMRANVCADKVSLAKTRNFADLNCRRCHKETETLGHILGQCENSKANRIARHDEIKHFIEKKMLATRGTEVCTEERFALPSGEVRQPDLVVKNQKGVFVVDVTVRSENFGQLHEGAKSKLKRYKQILPMAREFFSADKSQVVPIVVGARGCLPRQTQEGLKMLGITSRADKMTIALMALRASLEIYHSFFDGGGNRPLGAEDLDTSAEW